MKVLSLIYLCLLLSACKSNLHDGIYAIGFDASSSSLTNEIIRIEGNEIYHYQYSWGGVLQGENKLECKQFENRIEYEEEGSIKVMRVQEDHSLKIRDNVVFVRVGNLSDTFVVNEKKAKPLIHVNDGVIKIEPEKNPDDGSLIPAGIKIKYIGDDLSYCYVTNVSANPREPFFQGEKSFGGYIDDVYQVTIEGDDIKIVEPADNYNIVFEGTVSEGRILDQSGKESKFTYKGGGLYRQDKPNEYVLFRPLAE